MANSKGLTRVLLLLTCCLALLAPTASAYLLGTDESGIYVITWEAGTIPFSIKLPAPATPLSDGTTYAGTVQAAMADWNAALSLISFSSQVAPAASNATGNGINEIVMADTVDGSPFGANVVAVTLAYHSGNEKVEADIIFNGTKTWDSYRGPIAGGRLDLRRVALHELGHVVGLIHPDEDTPSQQVSAIMNSQVGDLDRLQSDDRAGAAALYGSGSLPPNNAFTAASILAGDSAEGTNIGATKEPGEPSHGGNSGGRSVWWRWTPESSGSANVTTLGSNFDTTLSVYTGSAVGSLSSVASNDDVEEGVIRSSTVSFAARAGVTYHIAVDGWSGYFGRIRLNLSHAPTPVSIVSQPRSQTVMAGETVTFTVAVMGDAARYQWYKSGVPLATGGTGATLTLPAVQPADAGRYQVRVLTPAGATTATSEEATLTIVPAVQSEQVVTQGRGIALISSAPSQLGSGGQWQLSTDGGATWNTLAEAPPYSGVQSAELVISAVTSSLDGYRYRRVIDGIPYAGVALSVSPRIFSYLESLSADGAGNLYGGDTATHVVYRVTSAGRANLLAGAAGQAGSTDGTGTSARFNQPAGLAVGSGGEVWVVDEASNTVRRISAAGAVTTVAGAPTAAGSADGPGNQARFSGPVGIAVASGGTRFVADSGNHTIRRIAPDGQVGTLAGQAGTSGSADGTSGDARFHYPTGLAVDGQGNLLVADTLNHTIRRVSAGGVVTTLAGSAGIAGAENGSGPSARFNRPRALAVDASGEVYVADAGNHVIRRIAPSGDVTILAGIAGAPGMRDGQAGAVRFNEPTAIVLGSDGSLYVADSGNAAIRRVTLDGVVTTLELSAAPPPPAPPAPSTAPPPPATGGGGSGGGSSGSSGGGAVTPGYAFLVLLTLLAGRAFRKVAHSDTIGD